MSSCIVGCQLFRLNVFSRSLSAVVVGAAVLSGFRLSSLWASPGASPLRGGWGGLCSAVCFAWGLPLWAALPPERDDDLIPCLKTVSVFVYWRRLGSEAGCGLAPPALSRIEPAVPRRMLCAATPVQGSGTGGDGKASLNAG